MGVKITDKDNGYRQVLTNVRSLRGTVVRVGVNEEMHVARNGNASGLTNAALGAIHEFGLGHVPQRSFIRAWIDENQRGVMRWLKEHLYRALMGREAWADNFGKYVVEGIRARINLGIPPPLEDETVRRKGHATPLIESEQLVKAIEYDVVRLR